MPDSVAAPDPAALLAAAEAACDRAGAILRPLFRAGLAAELKPDHSPVTRADREAEAAMREEIAARFPGHGLLGEEFGIEREASPWRWVIDPIDGTRAFITGRPSFGVLVGLLHEGAPVLGVIDQPILGERWIGRTGHPTAFRGPFGGRAGIRPCRMLADAELSCTTPEMLDATETARWRRLAARTRRVSWGGDCYAYGLLALGQIDAIVEADLKPWDWAALLPVVEGAGGRVTDWEGRALQTNGPGRVLAVGDPALLPQAVAALAEARPPPRT